MAAPGAPEGGGGTPAGGAMLGGGGTPLGGGGAPFDGGGFEGGGGRLLGGALDGGGGRDPMRAPGGACGAHHDQWNAPHRTGAGLTSHRTQWVKARIREDGTQTELPAGGGLLVKGRTGWSPTIPSQGEVASVGLASQAVQGVCQRAEGA